MFKTHLIIKELQRVTHLYFKEHYSNNLEYKVYKSLSLKVINYSIKNVTLI